MASYRIVFGAIQSSHKNLRQSATRNRRAIFKYYVMKPLLLVVLSFILSSCKNHEPSKEYSSKDFQGKTFNIKDVNKPDTLIVEFLDSTFLVYNTGMRTRQWELIQYHSSNVLALGDILFILDNKKQKGKFNGLFVGESRTEVEFIQRQKKWQRANLIGKWVEDIYTLPDGGLPPPLPAIDNDSLWPPFYSISEKDISLAFGRLYKSNYHLNESNEFVTFDLDNPLQNEKSWRILKLSDSLMTIQRTLQIREYVEEFDTIILMKMR